MKRERQEGEQVDCSGSQTGMHYEVIHSAELARRWVLPVNYVCEHVRSRVPCTSSPLDTIYKQ